MTTERKPDDDVRRLIRLAGARPGAGSERAARVRANVHAHWQQGLRDRSRTRRLYGWGGLLAAAAIVVAIGAVLLRGDGAAAIVVAHRDGAPLVVGERVTTAAERASLKMASGHSVRLDVDSALQLVAPGRLELERGALYVDSGAERPATDLSVQTRLGLVEELGTQFELRDRSDGVRVRVREGSVRVRGDAGSRVVGHGFEVTLVAGPLAGPRPIEIHGAEWEWVLATAPMPALDGMNARQFLDWAAREGGWRLVVVGALAPETIELSGSIEGLTVIEALETVLPTCGMAHRIEAADLIVTEAADLE